MTKSYALFKFQAKQCIVMCGHVHKNKMFLHLLNIIVKSISSFFSIAKNQFVSAIGTTLIVNQN